MKLQLGGELGAGLAGDEGRDDLAFGPGRGKDDFGKLFGAAHMRIFHQDMMGFADLGGKMFGDLDITCCAQARCT